MTVNPYAPFALIGDESFDGVMLTEAGMQARVDVFAERADDGWSGNGYDWTSVARVLVAERFPQYEDMVAYDREAGMFFARGPREILTEIALALQQVYDDDQSLRDLLLRAELD